MTRIAVAQIEMRWSTAENVAAILCAMDFASSRGARLCAFSELAVTGYHRQIGREATPDRVLPAVRELRAHCAKLSLGIAVGAPTFGTDAARYNSHLLVDEQGETRAVVVRRPDELAECAQPARGKRRGRREHRRLARRRRHVPPAAPGLRHRRLQSRRAALRVASERHSRMSLIPRATLCLLPIAVFAVNKNLERRP